MVGFAVAGFFMHWALGLFMIAVAAFIVALTHHVRRDSRGKWGLRIELDADAAKFDLPSGRSLIHRPRAQHLTIPYADIEAIDTSDTRLETYRSQGMAIMQRSYVLHRRNGELVFLFEERALATALAAPMFSGIVAELVAKAGVKLRGSRHGRGSRRFARRVANARTGLGRASLSPARQRQLWRRAARGSSGDCRGSTGCRVAVIDPRAGRLVRMLSYGACHPQGIAFGPDQSFALGCSVNGDGGLPPVILVMNAKTGATVATIAGIGGADMVAYGARNRQYPGTASIMSAAGSCRVAASWA
jgi:hypothetical protein